MDDITPDRPQDKPPEQYVKPYFATNPPVPMHRLGDAVESYVLINGAKGPVWVPAQPQADSRPTVQEGQPRYYGQADTTGAQQTLIITSWVITLITLGYMLPWAIAASRRSSNATQVAVVTLFLGWTFIGWVIGLVMAFKSTPDNNPHR